MPLKLVNWNVEKATPRSWKKAPEIRRRIGQHAPEIICLTETHTELWPQEDYTICAQPYGEEDLRKVLLWSKEPWEQVDNVGSNSLLPGRFVSGVTQTSVGEVTIIGVCIPYFMSRVSKSDVKPWGDYRQYLDALTGVLERAYTKRLMVVGDFNKRISKSSDKPGSLLSALQSAIPSRMTIATSAFGFQGCRSIDHIALGEDLAVESLGVISNMDGETELSDHFGVVAEVSAKNPS